MMNAYIQRTCTKGPAVGLILLACLTVFEAPQAEEPMLAIRLTGGESAVYPVVEIERISFEGDTLRVTQISGEDAYAAATIARMEFLWDFSSVDGPEDVEALRRVIHLFQNQPNPFSPETRIDFELPRACRAQLSIFSPSGRLVRTLVDEERAAGPHSARWDGRDDEGRPVAGGVYFYSLTAPGLQESRRMILLPPHAPPSR